MLKLSAEELREHSIGVIAYQHGETVMSDFLMLCILDLLEFINLADDKKMGARQIMQTAELILSEHTYRSMTLEDYKIFFTRIKKGDYGVIYGRIDGQMLLQWLSEYWDERALLFAEKSEKEAFSQTSPSTLDRRIGSTQMRELTTQTLETLKP